MNEPIGIRLPEDILVKIERISKKRGEDRSTLIRNLVVRGYIDLMKQTAAEEYMKGNITLSEAAYQANLTLWEMEKYLVERGFKSEYSIKDLESEIKLLEE